jgi:hypothetical protein
MSTLHDPSEWLNGLGQQLAHLSDASTLELDQHKIEVACWWEHWSRRFVRSD